MKVSNYAMNSQGVWMDLEFNQMKTDAKLCIVGSNSDQYAQYEKKFQQLYLKSGGKKLKPSDIEKANIDKHISCVLDWKGLEDDNGKEMPCSYENKKKIFGDREKYKWIIDQVEDFIGDDSNFLSKKSMES